MTTKPVQAHASLLDKFNPIPQKTQDQFAEIVNVIDKVITWFKHFRENVTQISIDFMTWSYDAIASVVLHTPLFLFDSSWFKDNIVMFTGLSIAMSVVLAMYEGFQRIGGHIFKGKRSIVKDSNHTDMARISRRIPLVVIGSALAPVAFYYGFKAINWLTDAIINVGKSQMAQGISGLQLSQVSWLEMLVFIAFDVALIGMMIPVFLQNFRRWFDLMALGVMTPVVLSCWMFKAHEHYFHTWWEHIKKCSMTQLVYAVFLLIIGSLMFGTKAPESVMELVIKIGVVIGGLWRMNNPPNIMRRYVDTGSDVGDMWKGAGKAITPHPLLNKGLKLIKGLKGGKRIGGASA